MSGTSDVQLQLKKICELTNLCGKKLFRQKYPNTCILSSAALIHVLTEEGYGAEPLRVQAAVFPAEFEGGSTRKTLQGCVLGSDGDGSRMAASAPDMWRGHLVVLVRILVRSSSKLFLLDPTLDQVNSSQPHLLAEPVAVQVSEEWLTAGKFLPTPNGPRLNVHRVATGSTGAVVDYLAFPKRGGWKQAADWRVSHWSPLANRVSKKLRNTW